MRRVESVRRLCFVGADGAASANPFSKTVYGRGTMPGTVRTRATEYGQSYQARWRPPGDGRDSERRSKTFKSKPDAQQWLRDIGNCRAPRPPMSIRVAAPSCSPTSPTSGWRSRSRTLEPRTHSDYTSTVRTWLVPETVTRSGYRSPFDKRVSAHHCRPDRRVVDAESPTSARHRTMVKTYGVAAQIMAFATRRGYIAMNPCESVKLPRANRADYDPDTGDFIEAEPPSIAVLRQGRDHQPSPTPCRHPATHRRHVRRLDGPARGRAMGAAPQGCR